MSALATQAANDLVASWKHSAPEFPGIIRLLKELGQHTWFLPHGGREVYRGVLNGLLEQLSLAGAYDWLEILTFPNAALEWTEEDELSLSSALEHYREDGVYQERADYTTIDELNGLRESLDELSKKYGLDFASSIESLDEAIAEREDSREYEGGEYGYRGGGGGGYQEAISDDDVAQMFGTLRSND